MKIDGVTKAITAFPRRFPGNKLAIYIERDYYLQCQAEIRSIGQISSCSAEFIQSRRIMGWPVYPVVGLHDEENIHPPFRIVEIDDV